MTVHGAKGLQAPLVILPDTTALPPDEDRLLWADDPQTGVRGAAVVAAQGAALRRRRRHACATSRGGGWRSTTGCSTSR